MARLPFLAFFASGASSLIFQTLWTRMLHHVFGATSVAMSSVLTAFMAGLGLGAFWFGRRAHRIRQPLAVYALCELGVAAWALGMPWLLRPEGVLADVNAALRSGLGVDTVALTLGRFLCVFPLLVVPTTLMGGTLPLLVQHFVGTERSDGTSSRIGALYAINTLGAVAGTLLSSFALMPWLGVRATNVAGVTINLALALSIFGMPTRPAQTQAEPAPDEPSQAAAPDTPSRPVRRLVLWSFGVSGACALAYEVVWSRALAMAIGSSMQSFALILTTFLLGIAGGSAVLSADLSHGAARPLRSLRFRGVAACALLCIALSPTFVLTSRGIACAVLAFGCLTVSSLEFLARARARREADLGGGGESTLDRAALGSVALPCLVSVLESIRFATRRGELAAVTVHGYLPYIATGVVLTTAGFLALGIVYRTRRVHLAGMMQLMVGLCTFASYLFQDEIPYAFARMVSSLHDLPSHVGTVRFFMFLSAGLCTLPATLCLGAMFPITLGLWGPGRRAGEQVAAVYTTNTIGSICGAWLPGFVLMPLLGMERTLHLGMLLNGLLALALLLAASARVLSAVTLGLLTAFALGVFTPRSALHWNLSHMTLGAFRVSLAHNVLDPATWGDADLLYYRDGVSTTVSVERWGSHLSLKNNGKVDASNGDDMPTQIMVAAYPLLLHRRAGRNLDVAVVGFGSGVSVGAALQFPVRHIDAMELERDVVEAAVDFFSDVNHMQRSRPDFPYVDVPRLTLTSDDGRNFLASTQKRYDVIVSEPSNPWITGVADLFTVEHFRVSKARLKRGGLYCQWVQLYEMSPDNIKIIYRTFASQFAFVLAFAAEELSSDTILVGSDAPIDLNLDRLATAMSDPTIKRELARAFVHSPYHVLSRLLFASREEILRFAGSAPSATLNTDDNMWIELHAPADLIGFARYEGTVDTFYGADWPYGDLTGRVRGLDSDAERSALSLSLLGHGRRARARALRATITSPATPDVDDALRTIDAMVGEGQEPLPEIGPAAPGPQIATSVQAALRATEAVVHKHRRDGHFEDALLALERLPSVLIAQSGPDLRFLHAYLLYKAGASGHDRMQRAAETLEDLMRRDAAYTADHPELFYYAARARDAASHFEGAVSNMRAYVERTRPVQNP